MKKSLFALAAVGAFAGAAQAQSSVTVYGILDVGYIGANEKDTIASTTTKQQTSGFGQSAQQSSRLGFRGNEDLGGGMRAFFTFETDLTPNNGATMSGVTNRQSFVGLAQKGIGQFSFGTQYTVIHNALAATDPGQINNVAGNVLNPQASTATGALGSSSSDGNNLAYTVRSGNMLVASTDTFAGLRGNAFYVQNNQNSTQNGTLSANAGGTVNNTGWGIGANYTWQKLLVTANYQSFKGENNTSAALVSISSQGALANVNSTDNQMYFGGMYDFGILKAYIGYMNRKITSNLNSNIYVQRSAQQIGVRGNLTKTVEGWASVGTGRFNAAGGSSPTVNFNGWQLGSNYWLSKRTNLYAIYGQEQTSNSNVAGRNANYALSNYALGVRHTF